MVRHPHNNNDDDKKNRRRRATTTISSPSGGSSSSSSISSSTDDDDNNKWNDRIKLQRKWGTLEEKGWKVNVIWKNVNDDDLMTQSNNKDINDDDDDNVNNNNTTTATEETTTGGGSTTTSTTNNNIGLFANEDIKAGTVLRIGKNGINLIEFQSIHDIELFCNNIPERLNYVRDYLWGFYADTTYTDENGYPIRCSGNDNDDNDSDNGDDHSHNSQKIKKKSSRKRRFYGMWLPGNGLNHSNTPNTKYEALPDGGTDHGIALIALCDINKGEQLFDDYRRHGMAPAWLKQFAQQNNITLNFRDCNDFVCKEST